MRKPLIMATIAPLLLVGLAACSSGSTGTAASATAVNTNPPASPSASLSADDFCKSVDELLAKAKAESAEPTPAESVLLEREKTLQVDVEKLSVYAEQLSGNLNDQAEVDKVQKCAKKLSEIQVG
jgi:hypothetical protein